MKKRKLGEIAIYAALNGIFSVAPARADILADPPIWVFYTVGIGGSATLRMSRTTESAVFAEYIT